MTDAPVLYDVKDHIATITLNRPEKLNCFNAQVIAELVAAFTRAGEDGDVRAVVLRGNGKSFCAGGDINWMRQTADYTREENIEDAMQLGRLLELVNVLPKPTVALVHGHVFGGGVGLSACCDIAVAQEDAVFCLSEVRIGLIPSIIAPYVIAAMGERQARRYFMTAERFDAATAHRIGFVHEVAPAGGLEAALAPILGSVLEGAPGAQARGKRLMLEIAGRPVDDDIVRLTAEQIAEARASDEGREGLSAFLAKREPAWRKKG